MKKKREDIVLPLLFFLPQHEMQDAARRHGQEVSRPSYVGGWEAQQESQLIKRQPGMHKVEAGMLLKAFHSQSVMLHGALWPANWKIG